MKFYAPLLAILLSAPLPTLANVAYAKFDGPLHDYWKRVPKDRFSQAMAANPKLDTSGELPLLRSILTLLDVPVNSQLLVFSSTSLQSAIVNPRNPRAIYFNEDTSVGFVPGGKIEIASLDPEAGMNFFIFDRLRPGAEAPRFVRSDKCMNCHADTPSQRLPGLVVDSVAASWDGSSLETYRHDEMGHTVPLEQRFGGWHLTGGFNMRTTHANLVGDLSPKGLTTTPNPPGAFCNLERYPLPTSDILPHLVHEHQVGFLNLVVESIYLRREFPKDTARINEFAQKFADYILFKNEAKLPPQGITGDPAFIKEFQARGKELREFDLKTRLFRKPVSYMMTTSAWKAVPQEIRSVVLQKGNGRIAP